jgi:hypothetical protein
MNNEEIIKKLRTSLENSVKRFLKFSASDMTQLTTTDGDTLSVDATDLEIGASVYSVDDNGNLTPAEDGDYTFDDGRAITIADGKISNISGTPASQDDTTSPDTEMASADTATAPTDAPATTEPDATDNSDLADRVSKLEAEMQQVLQVLTASTSMNENLMKSNETLQEKVEMLSKEPATTSIKPKKVSLTATTNNYEIENIRKMQKALTENNIKF